MTTKRQLTSLTAEQRDLAMERFSSLRPYFEDGVPFTRLARESGIPLRTLKRWSKQYGKDGLVGLSRRSRTAQGAGMTLPEPMKQLIEGLALQVPPPTVANIHRQIVSIGERNSWKVPSYSLIYKIVSNIERSLLTLAHGGSKEYKVAFDLIHRFEAVRPNEIWQSDHTLLDCWIQHGDKRMRPWLTSHS